MIEVSCGILVCDGKLFAVQKGEQSSHPYKWEFPGGKIAAGETDVQCVIRELKEELLIDVAVEVRIDPVEFAYGDKIVRLIPFVCRIVKGTPVLIEHIAQRWITLNEVKLLDWAEADLKLISVNRNQIQAFLSDPIGENHCNRNENGCPA